MTPSLMLLQSSCLPSDGAHCAFTDLVLFQDRLWCVFREAGGHISADGHICLLQSEDGTHWRTAACFHDRFGDLRDPHLLRRPDGRLQIHACSALHQTHEHRYRNLTWLSEDGLQWSKPVEIGEPNMWLWRMVWSDETALALGYKCGKPHLVHAYESDDGLEWHAAPACAHSGDYASESALSADGGHVWCLLRRDPGNGLLGRSTPPWTHWQWRDIGQRIASPQCLRLPNGHLLACVRLYQPEERACLAWVDTDKARLTECLALPSGGDCGYAGMVLWRDCLWVSYYSSHQGPTRVYLAKVGIEDKGAAN